MKRLLTNRVVTHHTVYPQAWGKQQLTNALQRQFTAIPYHIVIGNDWEVIFRDIEDVTWHANNYPVNLSSVAICLNGDFTKDRLTEYQEKRLGYWIRHLMDKYNIPRNKVSLHNEVRLGGSTACPGINQTDIDRALATVPSSEANLELVRGSINQHYRNQFKREPIKEDNDYFLSRIGQPEPVGINTIADLITKMRFWSRQKDSAWKTEREKVLNK